MTNNEAIGILAIVVETAKGRCFVTDEAISDAYAMAIKALEAQDSPKSTAESVQNVQNEDLISRKAAIEAVSKGCEEWRGIYARCEANLLSLPSVQPEPQWIPCSERLPEVGHSVLLSRRSMDTREGCLQADGKWWQYRWNEILNANQVNAWMPLPESYREERRADDLQ